MAANEYTRHLYSDDLEGYIQVMRLNSREVIKIYNTELSGIRAVVQEQRGQQDTFISPNSFFIPKRGNNNIRHYRALYIDLDLKEYSKTEAVYQIYILIGQGAIPEPTMIVDSGRGIHCYWRIDHAPVQAKYTWQELEDYLYKQLKYLGADLGATDGARVLRLPGTINSRNNEPCKIIRCNNRKYSMYELREKYLHYKPKKEYKPRPKQSRPRGKVKPLFNSYTLHIARARDMETLCLLRQYRVTGYRNKLLHCFIYWKGICIRNTEELQAVATRFNNNFTEPLTNAEVRATVKSTILAIEKFIDYEQGLRSGEDKRISKAMRERGGYWYTNERLIEMLNITEREQQHLKTIIGTKEKYRRNNLRRTPRNDQGLTTREQSKADNVETVQELAEQGLTQVEIARKAGITQQYVSKILINNQKYN